MILNLLFLPKPLKIPHGVELYKSKEYDVLVWNDTWELVPLKPKHNLLGCKWIFRIKHLLDSSVIGIKPTLLPNDFNNDMMLIIMILSILLSNPPLCLVLNIVVSCGWFICQLDVNNVFFQGYLFENVFMVQPLGFIDCDYPYYVCKICKPIYGLKQIPRVCYHELCQFLMTFGFIYSHASTSLLVLNISGIMTYLFIYVDDIIITCDNDGIM